ncbi:MAG TPA: FkbM family methyltransferase [Puia sp.]|nr:FkbM family methyltransferase [Puia sp.]
MSFSSELMKELLIDSKNNFSYQDNYDHIRFGNIAKESTTVKGSIRKRLEKVFESRGYSVVQKEKGFEETIREKLDLFDPYLFDLEKFYNILSDENSKKLLLQIIAFRILGFTKVKLPINTPEYWKGIKDIEAIADENKFLISKFMNWHLPFVDLNKKGIPVQLYLSPVGIYTDFFIKQYEFANGDITIKANKGDYVIDAGGCWGDTALYFAAEVGDEGKIFTYEFIPSNLEFLDKNLSLNPNLKQRVTVIQKPVWETSNEIMYYNDRGPGSHVFMEEPQSYDGKVNSLSIDDLVFEKSIPKIDFIKMDIEGAEPYALKGAVNTISKFKPKLAIAIYHSLGDFVGIPKFIDELKLGYKFYLAHCSIHEEESIMFAEIPGQ